MLDFAQDDSITSERTYKDVASIKDARIELRRCAGTQFDPKVLAMFLSLSDDELIATRVCSELSSEAESALDWT